MDSRLRHNRRLLDVAGPPDSPLLAALRRTYVDLLQTRRGSFRHFLRRTLDRCTLHVEGARLTVTGGARTATYTAKQWTTMHDVLTRE